MGEAESNVEEKNYTEPPVNVENEEAKENDLEKKTVDVDFNEENHQPSTAEDVNSGSCEESQVVESVKVEEKLIRSKRTRKLPKSKDLEDSCSLTRTKKEFSNRRKLFKKKRGPIWSMMPLKRYSRSGFPTRRAGDEKVRILAKVKGNKPSNGLKKQVLKSKQKIAKANPLLRSPEKFRSKQSVITRSVKLKLLMTNLENMRNIELQNLRAMRKLALNFGRRVVPPELSHFHQIIEVNVMQCEEVIRRIDRVLSTMVRLQRHGLRLSSRLKALPLPKSSNKSTKVAEIRRRFVERINVFNEFSK